MMRCIVVDDEPMAMELAKGYVLKTPFLTLMETFTNPFKALSYLLENEVDLIFLDINMPELSGMQLLKSLSRPPLVIFTTAYAEFGAESYNFDAVDYLLKPITYVRFLKSANKAFEIFNLKHPKREEITGSAPSQRGDKHIMVKSGTQFIKVDLRNLLYIEGAGNYLVFQTKDKKFLSLMTMKELLEILPEEKFVRVHKSFVISLSHIDTIETHQVVINGKFIPIGQTYRLNFFRIAIDR